MESEDKQEITVPFKIGSPKDTLPSVYSLARLSSHSRWGTGLLLSSERMSKNQDTLRPS